MRRSSWRVAAARSVVVEFVRHAAVGAIDSARNYKFDSAIGRIEILLRKSDIDGAAEEKRHFRVMAKPDRPIRSGAEIWVEVLVKESALWVEKMREDVFAKES